MRLLFPRRLVLGLGVLLVSGLWAADLAAQPPGRIRGKGPKGPPGPPPDAEFMTVRGTVREFTSAPKGEVDGLMLNDGTWVHWPPHLQDRFTALVAKGDRVRASGFWETGPKGDTKLEVSTLTNLGSNRTAENPDQPPVGPGGLLPGRGGDVEDRLQRLEERLDQLIRVVERLRRTK